MNTAKNFDTILLQLNEVDVFEVAILLTLFRMWGQKAPSPNLLTLNQDLKKSGFSGQTFIKLRL